MTTDLTSLNMASLSVETKICNPSIHDFFLKIELVS